MGKSAESFQRNFSDAEARVEGYLPVGRGLPGLGVWGLRGYAPGFSRGLSFPILNPKLLGPFSL